MYELCKYGEDKVIEIFQQHVSAKFGDRHKPHLASLFKGISDTYYAYDNNIRNAKEALLGR